MKKLSWLSLILVLIPISIYLLAIISSYFHIFSNSVLPNFITSGIFFATTLILGFILAIISSFIKERTTGQKIASFVSILIFSLVVITILSAPKGRPKGEDAITKANLANLRAQAEIVYNENSKSYQSVCTGESTLPQLAGAKKSSKKVSCFSSAENWVTIAMLKDKKTYYCVDSKGASKTISSEEAANIVNTTTLCPSN